MTQVLLQNLSRFVILDSFESLWRKYLKVFGYYLGAAPPLGDGFEVSFCKSCPELAHATETCIELLKSTLASVDSMGLFGTKERRSTAWSLMKQQGGNLIKAPDVCREYV